MVFENDSVQVSKGNATDEKATVCRCQGKRYNRHSFSTKLYVCRSMKLLKSSTNLTQS